MTFSEIIKLQLSLILLFTLKLCCLVLPYRWQLSLGRRLGELLIHHHGKMYHTTLKNLQLCFPQLTKSKRHSLLKKTYRSVGMASIEMLMSWWLPNHKTTTLLAVYGREHIDNALKKHGVILISPHFNTLELVGRLLTQQLDFYVMYRPQKIKLLDLLMRHYRKKYYKNIIIRNDLRTMIKKLKEKQIVWYAPDGDHGIKNSV